MSPALSQFMGIAGYKGGCYTNSNSNHNNNNVPNSQSAGVGRGRLTILLLSSVLDINRLLCEGNDSPQGGMMSTLGLEHLLRNWNDDPWAYKNCSGTGIMTPEHVPGPTFHPGVCHSSLRTSESRDHYSIPKAVISGPGQVSCNPFHIFIETSVCCNAFQRNLCKSIGICASHYIQWAFRQQAFSIVPNRHSCPSF